MEYWITIPMFLFFLALGGTNFELLRLKKEVEELKRTKNKKKVKK
jgi:hypothetical protein